MQFVKINYHLNQRFYIEDKAYKKMISKALKTIKNIYVEEIDVKIDEKLNNFIVNLEVKKDKKDSYDEVARKITSTINDGSALMTTSKPQNITIDFI